MNSRPVARGDRLAQRGLAHARRSDEAQDRPAQLLRPLLHGEILDDPLLDLLQPVMVVVQHLLGAAQVLLDARLHAPRDRQHPLEIVPHHRRLGRHRRHRLQLLDLGQRLLMRLLGQLRVLDPLFQLGDLVGAVLAVAQLLLDRLHLLVQVIFALGPLHLRLDPRLDLLLDLQDAHLALHQAIDLLQPLGDRQGLQKLLLLLDLDAQMPGHQVGKLRRLAGLADRDDRFLGDVLLDLRIARELLRHRAHQRLHGVAVAHGLGQDLDLGLEVAVILDEVADLHARLALDQHLHGAVRQLQKLQHVGEDAGAVDAIGHRFVHRRVDLRRQQDLLVVLHHRLQRPHRLLAPDEQRHDHVREHDNVAQWKDGMGLAGLLGHVLILARRKGSVPRNAAAPALPGLPSRCA